MMRRIEFAKLHGAGNDFIFIEDLDDALDLGKQQVAALCDRHFGIGADGVIVVKPPRDPANDGFMHYMNSDGTLAQMCGNGIRCFAKYLVDRNLVRDDTHMLRIETRAGVKEVSFTTDSGGKLVTATVDMGSPAFEPSLIPAHLEPDSVTPWGDHFIGSALIDSPFGAMRFACLSMGNPHAIAFVDDVQALDVETVGAFYESCDAFPEKCNIEFAQVTDRGIAMRVYERGCGETLACGTGACATGVAAYLTGRAGLSNDLVLRGGTLHIEYEPGGHVTMTGPAQETFTGTILLTP